MIAYKTFQAIKGPLAFIKKTSNVGYQELVKIKDPNGKEMLGQVVSLEGDLAIVQMFEESAGFQLDGATAVFEGETMKIPLSPTILGRIYNGLGKPLDNLEPENGKDAKEVDILPFQYRDVYGAAINPYRRSEPHDFIETGISSIDLGNTVVKGQKIPIFSGSGLPDLEILTQIAANAKTKNAEDKFTVVVAAMGISNDDYLYLLSELEKTGSLKRSVLFVNLASDPVVERILTPRLALTTAEYLAYELGFSVLTLMFDLTNYANALREISSAKEEIPGRSGYPGYLYTDLASLLERAGTVEGKKGSNTLIPILTMPNDEKTHPVPDLTGYITEGQIMLNRGIYKKGYYPCIDILDSLSRLKDKGQGEGKTREDHDKVADQMFASLAESIRQQDLSSVLGVDSLTDTGRKYLEFNKAYFERFLNQGKKARSIEETLDLAWELFAILPREELKKIKDNLIEKYGKGKIKMGV
jgi:V/A-type H+-transporting ATPase subunit B